MTSTSTQSGEAGSASKADTSPAAPRAPRVPRRSPAELPFRFADRDLVESLVAERAEPEWLRDDRIAALEAFEALPVEANQLYTPYIDLRGALLDEVRPWVRTASAPAIGSTPAALPEGVDGLIELREDEVVAIALSPAARRPGSPSRPSGPPWLGTRMAFASTSRATPPSRRTTSSPSSPEASGARASGSSSRIASASPIPS